MPDSKTFSNSSSKASSLPFETGDPGEQKLWAALEELPRGEPSSDLRGSFYRGLETASSRSLAVRLREWLGLGSNMGWVTAAACLVLGFGLSQTLLQQSTATPGAAADDGRLAALEQNVSLLNRELILGRLTADSTGMRLQGVVQAGNVAAQDGEVARALLATAMQDRSLSVRSAAIDALGPQLGNAEFGQQLMSLLEEAESPIVQLALVDLILRHGSTSQLEHLRVLAEQERLHADLVSHVLNSLGVQTT